jgi:hypothetical protein
VAVSEETRRLLMNSGAGRHTRLPDLTRLHRACVATLMALVAEFALGMWLNLYVAVPAADQHAGIVQVITNGPLLLTVHALLGTFLIAATIVLLIRAVKVGDSTVIGLASLGLGAVIGAFAAGEFFARDGESKTSLWMAVLTGIALLSYIAIQARTGAAHLAQARRGADSPPEPAPRLPYRQTAPRPGPGGAPAPAAPPWPEDEYGPARGRRPAGYRPGMTGPSPAYRQPGSGPQPAYPRTATGPQPAYRRAEVPRAMRRGNPPQQQWRENRPYPRQPGPADAGYPEES